MKMVLILVILDVVTAHIPISPGGDVTLTAEGEEVNWSGKFTANINKIQFSNDQNPKINAAIKERKKMSIEFHVPVKEMIVEPSFDANMLAFYKKVTVFSLKKEVNLTGFLKGTSLRVNVTNEQLNTLKSSLNELATLFLSMKTMGGIKNYILENSSLGEQIQYARTNADVEFCVYNIEFGLMSEKPEGKSFLTN